MEKKASSRIVELDAVRGLAALAVLVFHYTLRYDQMFEERADVLFRFPLGENGVALFFILSGYVISLTLSRTKSGLDFCFNRFTRLYPVYWVAVAITAAVVWWAQLPGEVLTLKETLLNATMFQRLLGARHADGVYWSLQAEMFFYAAALVLWSTGAWRHLPRVLLGWVALAVAATWLEQSAWAADHQLAGKIGKLSTALNLPYIHLFGMGICFYEVHRLGHWTRPLAVALLACLATPLALGQFEAAAVNAVLAGFFWLAVDGRLPWLAAPVLVYLGSISYTLYLVHQNLGYVVIRAFRARGWDTNLAMFAATLMAMAVATALTWWVERPSQRWLRDWYRRVRPDRARTAAPALPAAAASPVPPSAPVLVECH